MDGFPNKKSKKWRGQDCSESRFYVNTWMEKELPLLSGSVINIGAGGSPIPKQLLDFSKVSKYTTFDKKMYGDNKNPVDVYGDVMNMPKDWSGLWDVALCIEVAECIPDLFKMMEEIYRILKPNGVLLLTCPFNYSAFGYGSTPESLKKKNHVYDYWRPTKQGWELLCKRFSKVEIKGFGGTGEWDRYCYCIKAVK